MIGRLYIKFFCVFILLVVVTTTKATYYFSKGEVDINITPKQKNGNFSPKTKVKYKLAIKNGTNVEQDGQLSYFVTNEEKDIILQKTFDLKIPAKKSLSTDIIIPQTEEGDFQVDFVVELNKVKTNFNEQFNYSIKKKTNASIGKKQKRIEIPESDGEEEGEIVSKMIPESPDGVYLGKQTINYELQLKNKYNIPQEGTFTCIVKDAINGTVISTKKYDILLSKKSNRNVKIKLAHPNNPGIYNLELAINTNTYDDTTHHAFCYEIAKISSVLHKPEDFEDFWKTAMNELAEVRPEYSISEAPEESTTNYRVYKVEMNSLENIRISAWLTIPKTIGTKFPVVVAFPGYQVKIPPLFFSDFICLSVLPRGTDPDNQADVNPEKKDLLTLNIEDPTKYIYRGIVMDCVRSIDFLFANEHMGFDLNRIAVFGGSQGGYLCLTTAALLPRKISACIADVPILCDLHTNIAMESQIREETFVLKYINRFLVANTGSITKENILQTACYYEGQNFISKIRCPVLMGVGLLDPLAPASTSIATYNKLSVAVKKESEIHVFSDLTHEVKDWHNVFKSMWFYEKLEQGTKKR